MHQIEWVGYKNI